MVGLDWNHWSLTTDLDGEATPPADDPHEMENRFFSREPAASPPRRSVGSLVSERIGELRGEKEALEDALAGIGADRQEAEDEELTEQLARLPDLSKALRDAPPSIKRQAFASFDLQTAYDKAQRRVELTATVSEAVADAFENAEALLAGGSEVVVRDIAGAGFEPATSGL